MDFRISVFSLGLLMLIGCSNQSEQTTAFSPVKPTVIGDDLFINVRDFGDLYERGAPLSNNLLDDPALVSVTREFGATTINLGLLPIKSGVAQSEIKPWSSWWFPKREAFIFTDRDGLGSSTLAKYDQIQRKKDDRAVSAVDYERSHHNGNGPAWEGLCDAWAIASITHAEPKRPVSVKIGRLSPKTLTFQVGELKALLLKSFEAVDDAGLQYYGQKFTGDQNGWIYPDLFPEQFHRFIEIQLFKNKQAFIMDHDPGIEVWNVPVYKANFTIEAIPNNPNAVFVRTWLYSAQAPLSTEIDFVGTKEMVREYNYVLEGTREGNNNFTVKSGYWVKGPSGIDSRKDHPDYFIRIPDHKKIVRKSWNPNLDLNTIDEILNQSY